MGKTLAGVVTVAVVVLFIASAPAVGARQPKVCTLVTNAEVAAAMGQKVLYRTQQALMCKWTLASLSKFTSAQPKLYIFLGKRETKTRFLEQARATPGAVLVRGVGEAAYWIPEAAVRQLAVFYGGYALTVYATDVTRQLQVESELAREALPRL